MKQIKVNKKEKVTENCFMFDRKKSLKRKKAMREIHEQQNQKVKKSRSHTTVRTLARLGEINLYTHNKMISTNLTT